MPNYISKAATWLCLLLSHNSPWVIIGAFSGSVIFILSANEFTPYARLALFSVSMFIGVISSDSVATILSMVISRHLDITVSIPPAVGAIIAAVTAVRFLMRLDKKQPANILYPKENEGLHNDHH